MQPSAAYGPQRGGLQEISDMLRLIRHNPIGATGVAGVRANPFAVNSGSRLAAIHQHVQAARANPFALNSGSRLPAIQQAVEYVRLKIVCMVRQNLTPAEITVAVPSSFSLYQLHDMIQKIFALNNSHQFTGRIHGENVTFTVCDRDTYFDISVLPPVNSQTESHQWIEHEHPHVSGVVQGLVELTCSWCCDERAISVRDAFYDESTKGLRTLEYGDYSVDFCTIQCEALVVEKPTDLRFPKILSCNNGGYYHWEDGFAPCTVNFGMMQAALNAHYDRQWTFELQANGRTPQFCYVCKNSDTCPNRTQCSGRCCVGCIKAVAVQKSINLEQFCRQFQAMKQHFQSHLLLKRNGQQCTYREPNGTVCSVCYQL